MTVSALIIGCSGHVLTAQEIDFLREFDPWGLILFQRNCQSPEQIKALISSFRGIFGRCDAPVLIDQEGGRVQRLGPPHWREYPAAGVFGDLFQKDRDDARQATYLITRLMAEDLHDLGISVDCLPVVDVPHPGADNIIGNRAYSNEPEIVAELAHLAAKALLDGGILPVIKHIPGHGRATVDSHIDLPRVTTGAEELRNVDFAPFVELSQLPLAMTAHVVYEAFDNKNPATLSPAIIEGVIRGQIGFDGLIMSDDLSMKALSGTLDELTCSAYAAGCDVVMHCNGDMAEMRSIAANVPRLAGKPLSRAKAALKCLNYPQDYDRDHALFLHSRSIQNSL